MDASQWPQGIGVEHHNKVMEPAAASRSPNSNNLTAGEIRRARPPKEQPLNCPRCNSTNTKFCYYNNYSLSQPRYFCKTCRRYWTEGGSLRNVPVGGGSRKNKRTPSSSSSNNTSSKKLVVPPDHHHQLVSSVMPKHNMNMNMNMSQAHQDLNLGYSGHHVLENQNPSPSPCSTSSPHFELLKSTSMSPFLHVAGLDSGTMFAGGFPIQEFKPTLNFSLEAFDHGVGGGSGHDHENGASARLLFPVEDLKQQVPNSSNPMERDHIIHHQATTGYWTGMLGGNSW